MSTFEQYTEEQLHGMDTDELAAMASDLDEQRAALNQQLAMVNDIRARRESGIAFEPMEAEQQITPVGTESAEAVGSE